MNLLNLHHATKDNYHLGKLIEDLPQNCFFNKVLCGAGGTHLALANKNKYIILVPTTDLIVSKEQQKQHFTHDICFVYGSKPTKDILKYINEGGTKVMSTYHALPKILAALEVSDFDTKDFQLLVDEAHMLTEGDDKDFMHTEINNILLHFNKFKSYCFMTATPFPKECFPEQIKDIPYVVADWNPDVVTKTSITAQQITSKFTDYVTKIAIDHMNGTKEGNAYFFYNSVEAISQVCYKLIKSGLCTLNDIRIIAADKNAKYLQKYVHPELIIEDVTTEPKKLNFLTAKAFEGCDIYDEDGVTYVCADARKTHTRLEIHTKIPQIVNRIRNSKYNQNVNLLYTKSFISTNVSKAEFIRLTQDSIDEATIQIEEMKTISESLKKLINTEILETSEYFTKDEYGNYIVNQNAGKRALALWEAANQTYTVFKNDKAIEVTKVRSPLIELLFNGGNTEEFTLPSGAEKLKLGGKKANFSLMCKDYLEALDTKDIEQVKFIEDYDDIFLKARTTFKGNIHQDFSACSYQRSNIEKRLGLQLQCNDSKLNQIIEAKFKIGSIVPKSKIIKLLEGIYQTEGISKKAKATDIKKWYQVKPTTNTKGENCFKIISKL